MCLKVLAIPLSKSISKRFFRESEPGSKGMDNSRQRRNVFVSGCVVTVISLTNLLLSLPVPRANAADAQQSATWIAPPAARSVKNPVRPSPQGLKDAGDLFQQICSSCHGPKGQGDGALAKALTPKPANFTDAKRMNKATDGELFWKMTNGRGPMPAWQQLPETQRWDLVNYLRTLTPKRNLPVKKDLGAN
jgi:mono/diheme cytochrome c family protein